MFWAYPVQKSSHSVIFSKFGQYGGNLFFADQDRKATTLYLLLAVESRQYFFLNLSLL